MTPETAKAQKPDVIIAAIGASAAVPDIPGIDGANVLKAQEAYAHPDRTGQRVAILGGGLVGLELGIYLKGLGKNVVIIEASGSTNDGDNFLLGDAIEVELRRLGIPVRLETKAERIEEGGVAVETPSGGDFIEADTVIYAVGQKGLKEEAKAFALCAPITYQIGDCNSPKNVYEANLLGFNVAMDLGKYV